MSIPKPLKSRKLWLTILGFGVTLVTNMLNLPAALVHNITNVIELLVPTYVGAQGFVDGLRYLAERPAKKTTSKRKNAA